MVEKPNLVRVAVTGGPGAGKTSLLKALETRGHSVVCEVAREIISDRKRRGLAPRPSPEEFAREIVSRDIEQYKASESEDGLVFFDRSLLDSLGMLNALNLLTATDRRRMLELYTYHPEVLILPPWPEIYKTDSERDQSFEESVRIYESLHRWCAECGYGVLEVPPGTIDERCDFLLQHFKTTAG